MMISQQTWLRHFLRSFWFVLSCWPFGASLLLCSPSPPLPFWIPFVLNWTLFTMHSPLQCFSDHTFHTGPFLLNLTNFWQHSLWSDWMSRIFQPSETSHYRTEFTAQSRFSFIMEETRMGFVAPLCFHAIGSTSVGLVSINGPARQPRTEHRKIKQMQSNILI